MTNLPVGFRNRGAEGRIKRGSSRRSPAISIVPAKGASAAVWITLRASAGVTMAELFHQLALVTKEFEVTIVDMTVFGAVSASEAVRESMKHAFGKIDWPVTALEGSGRHPVEGIKVFGVGQTAVELIHANGRVIGSVFEDDGFRHCVLGDVLPDDRTSSPIRQAQETLANMSEALSRAGFAFGDVVRTWFYLDDILSWYDGFNKVRTQMYSNVKYHSGSVPASTGVGAKNPAHTALVAGAWAVQPAVGCAQAKGIASPLQCPAAAYGSLFSRAMELSSPCGRRLFISGTASIAPEGQTLWREDVHRQVEQTMEVVKKILLSHGYEFRDLAQATAYFKRRRDFNALAQWCRLHGLSSLPVVTTQCEICRDDLLFELEAEAWQPNQRKEQNSL